MKRITSLVVLTFFLLAFSRCKKNSGSDKPKKAIVTTIAGTGEEGYLDASGAFAKFNFPTDVALHTDGTIYITDYNNRRVRKITQAGQVLTFAGNGNPGHINGSASVASFDQLNVITVDAQGNAYVFDGGYSQVRKISPGGDVAAFAGSGYFGSLDGSIDSARFKSLWGITMDAQGSIYVADTYNFRIRKIANGQVTTIAGKDTKGYADGNALQAQFNFPSGIANDKQGNLYVCDRDNNRIRKITPAGIVSTFAGNGTPGVADGNAGTAQFSWLGDMVIDKKGNLYVTDEHRIRKIDAGGEVTTIAGSVSSGFADGEDSLARFVYPLGLGIDAAGNIYVADTNNNRIRKISFQ